MENIPKIRVITPAFGLLYFAEFINSDCLKFLSVSELCYFSRRLGLK